VALVRRGEFELTVACVRCGYLGTTWATVTPDGVLDIVNDRRFLPPEMGRWWRHRNCEGAVVPLFHGRDSADARRLRQTTVADAERVLGAVLAEGPQPAAKCYELGRMLRISTRTLKSAKQRLGVLSTQERGPVGRRGGSRWYWTLPRGGRH
jgi:hypothetical protein